MDAQELNNKWPELKNRMLEKFPELTADELVYEIGKEEELLIRLQEKLGKNRKEIDEVLSLMG